MDRQLKEQLRTMSAIIAKASPTLKIYAGALHGKKMSDLYYVISPYENDSEQIDLDFDIALGEVLVSHYSYDENGSRLRSTITLLDADKQIDKWLFSAQADNS